jgi:2-methylisocitrate lyase-like PEP mutase family enzyme
MQDEQASLAARFREQNHAGRLLLPSAWDAASARIFEEAGFAAIGTTSAPSAGELFAAGAARVSIGQMAMLAALGSIRDIADELIQRGTWRSIERTFYGFGEAEGLFAPPA